MRRYLQKTKPLLWCSMLSILVHLLLLCSLRVFESYQLGAAVQAPPAVMVDLSALAAAAGAERPTAKKGIPQPAQARSEGGSRQQAHLEERDASAERRAPEPASRPEASPAPKAETKPEPVPNAALPEEDVEEHQRSRGRRAPPKVRPVVAADAAPALPQPLPALNRPRVATADEATMLRSVSDSLSAKYEKLTYLVSMYGIPIGNAELESGNENGVTVISLRVKSNPVIASYFPVDNLVETRHINGMFLVSNIKQNEGSFKSDQSFTINVPRKRVSCVDFRNSRTLDMEIPTGDVLDSLSGIYYLRNRQLEVGRTETLRIFDSETFAEVPVEVLRKEEMRLPNLAKVATVVVRPLQTTPGIFRRTGDVLIWMTDDDRKVPVKITTSIPIGRVTAELVSAESQPQPQAQTLTQRER